MDQAPTPARLRVHPRRGQQHGPAQGAHRDVREDRERHLPRSRPLPDRGSTCVRSCGFCIGILRLQGHHDHRERGEPSRMLPAPRQHLPLDQQPQRRHRCGRRALCHMRQWCIPHHDHDDHDHDLHGHIDHHHHHHLGLPLALLLRGHDEDNLRVWVGQETDSRGSGHLHVRRVCGLQSGRALFPGFPALRPGGQGYLVQEGARLEVGGQHGRERVALHECL
mmetsp:Transcript_99983/g.278471  ORF Transcript_99983/g.278471 Transcript_99983/m.278471 type:complete len:222 (+) Transcript_99983:2083-2748(+)